MSPASKFDLAETDSKEVRWWDPEIGNRLPPQVRRFFEDYSGIPENQLLPHLHEIHEKAWEIRPYPCIGQWGFLSPKIRHLPNYEQILERLKGGASILDLGCCLGQDLRYLANDGAPSSQMIGSDILEGFWQVGYDLFQDKDRFQAPFYQADVFDKKSTLWTQLHDVDIIYMGSFLHVFDWDEQLQALELVVHLSKPGSLVSICQIGVQSDGRSFTTGWKNNTRKQFFHDTQTVNKLFSELGRRTGSEWNVMASTSPLSAVLLEDRDRNWMGENARYLMVEAVRHR